MKNLLSVIFILLFRSCIAQDVTTIRISYVDLEIMTPITVECADFETLFKTQIRTILIKDKPSIDSIVQVLNNIEIDTSKYIPDVRVRIELNYADKSKIFCLSSMGIWSENTSYIMPDNLINMLKKYMK